MSVIALLSGTALVSGTYYLVLVKWMVFCKVSLPDDRMRALHNVLGWRIFTEGMPGLVPGGMTAQKAAILDQGRRNTLNRMQVVWISWGTMSYGPPL